MTPRTGGSPGGPKVTSSRTPWSRPGRDPHAKRGPSGPLFYLDGSLLGGGLTSRRDELAGVTQPEQGEDAEDDAESNQCVPRVQSEG